ncbi:MAG: metalloregulator ArsR/SmtB family transcription factor [Gemmatimonadota bacterium]|nr:metalloregulator ArsR/SmtB family transcription factor [Gemmatimonadota bacterium]
MDIKQPTTVRSVNPETLRHAAEVIKLLGHPERLQIVEVLEFNQGTVTEIQEILGMPQAKVSQHLAKLRGAGVVAAERDGVHVQYRVIEPKVHKILDCIRHCES